MRWRELSVCVDNEAVEAVSEVLRRWAPSGVAIIPHVAEAARDEGVVEVEGPVRVVAYLPEETGIEQTVRAAEEALGHLHAIWPIGPVESRTLDESEWEEAWKAHYHTHRIGTRFVIKPLWEEYESQPGDVVVELDPGMAFGTGLHPTTQLCLRALEQAPVKGAKVLDVGTGSGILAIGAAKLGAAHVLALDIDPIAVKAARQNVAANGLDARVRVEEGSLPLQATEAGSQYDIVVANIIARVIMDLAHELADVVAPGGTLIASGIIAERVDDVRDALRGVGFRVSSELEGDWFALIGTRG